MKPAYFINNPLGDNNWCKLHGYPMARYGGIKKHYSKAELSLVLEQKCKPRWRARLERRCKRLFKKRVLKKSNWESYKGFLER